MSDTKNLLPLHHGNGAATTSTPDALSRMSRPEFDRLKTCVKHCTMKRTFFIWFIILGCIIANGLAYVLLNHWRTEMRHIMTKSEWGTCWNTNCTKVSEYRDQCCCTVIFEPLNFNNSSATQQSIRRESDQTTRNGSKEFPNICGDCYPKFIVPNENHHSSTPNASNITMAMFKRDDDKDPHHHLTSRPCWLDPKTGHLWTVLPNNLVLSIITFVTIQLATIALIFLTFGTTNGTEEVMMAEIIYESEMRELWTRMQIVEAIRMERGNMQQTDSAEEDEDPFYQ